MPQTANRGRPHRDSPSLGSLTVGNRTGVVGINDRRRRRRAAQSALVRCEARQVDEPDRLHPRCAHRRVVGIQIRSHRLNDQAPLEVRFDIAPRGIARLLDQLLECRVVGCPLTELLGNPRVLSGAPPQIPGVTPSVVVRPARVGLPPPRAAPVGPGAICSCRLLIGERFDPQGDDFTLGRVSEFRLDTFADKIGELSSNASKELQIEVALEKIDEKWQVNELDMVPHKEGVPDVYRLRSAEDVFNDLEENIVALSTMKSSRFFLSFEDDITKWERALSLVSEMIEIILQVQRNWMYLENIFVGSEDIRKQLPAESNMFDFVDTTFKRSMLAMFEAKNVLKATHLPKMLDTFQDMDAKLERIQKSLDEYLETKRQAFPLEPLSRQVSRKKWNCLQKPLLPEELRSLRTQSSGKRDFRKSSKLKFINVDRFQWLAFLLP